MHRLVVDASIAVKWLNPHETLADKANLVRDDYEQGQISLLMPAFWDYEVATGSSASSTEEELCRTTFSKTRRVVPPM